MAKKKGKRYPKVWEAKPATEEQEVTARQIMGGLPGHSPFLGAKGRRYIQHRRGLLGLKSLKTKGK